MRLNGPWTPQDNQRFDELFRMMDGRASRFVGHVTRIAIWMGILAGVTWCVCQLIEWLTLRLLVAGILLMLVLIYFRLRGIRRHVR